MKLLDKKWKWAVAVILLLLAGYLAYRYFFYTCCALPPKSALTDVISDDAVSVDPDLLYSTRTTIGLCRTKSGDGGTCYAKTSLYFSGKLITERSEVVLSPDGEKRVAYPAVEKTLNKNTMDRIIKQIRDSGIMNKSCEAEMIMDYYVSYFISLDGTIKEARFPGCKSEFNEIDELIDEAA